MNFNEYKELKIKKGTIHQIHWRRTLSDKDVLKGFKGGRIEKETIGVFRIGVTYANMEVNKDKVCGSLPYGYFELSNEIIYSPTSNTYQLRITKTMNENHKPIVKWYLDGVEITKEELIEMNALGSTQRQSKPSNSLVYNVKLKDIISIK